MSIIAVLLSQLNQHTSSRLVVNMALHVQFDISHHVIDKYSRFSIQPNSQVKLISADHLVHKTVEPWCSLKQPLTTPIISMTDMTMPSALIIQYFKAIVYISSRCLTNLLLKLYTHLNSNTHYASSFGVPSLQILKTLWLHVQLII